jgi:hypothetical protein
MPSYSGSGCANARDYADLYLTKLKDAFIDANSSWSLETAIETIGSYSGDSYGLRTLQLKSSASGKYVRIWVFSYYVYGNIQSSESVNTDENIKIYNNNLFIQNSDSYQDQYEIGEYCEVYFGVSSSSIDADPAKNLGLDLPMFGIGNSIKSSSISLAGASYGAYYYGATLSVITDGSMFGVIKYINGNWPAVFYAPNMFVCANSSDTETAGIISCTGDSTNFYLGDNNNSNRTVCALFNAADGTHNFNGMLQGFSNGRLNNSVLTAESSSKMVCAPVCFWMYPYEYSGSSMPGVVNGIGLKGWINTDYIRSVDSRVLPFGSKGMKYGNGRWLCVDTGTLICWDDSNSSPFEAAV